MMATIGKGVPIDIDRLVESRLLIQANSGAGKSWAIRRLLEQMTNPERIAKGMWWDRAWSLVEGCTPAGKGCLNCWSSDQTHMRSKQSNEKILARYGGLTNDSGKFNGTIRLMSGSLSTPLKVKKPTTWAVWNDLFHVDVPDWFIAAAFGVMAACPWHTFIILTKRYDRMREILTRINTDDAVTAALGVHDLNKFLMPKEVMDIDDEGPWSHLVEDPPEWPLKNVIGGFSASTQADLEGGIEDLRATPLAVRVLSLEPLLGPIDLGPLFGLMDGHEWSPCLCGAIEERDQPCIVCESRKEMGERSGIHWVIPGAESGANRRPCEIQWIKDIIDQCVPAGIPLFVKQATDDNGKLVKVPYIAGKGIFTEFPR